MIGSVVGCWRYPVKSMQGAAVDELSIGSRGVEGDRRWGLIDVASGKLASAKRFSALLLASATDDAVTLPDGTVVALDGADVDSTLSAWLGRDVIVRQPEPTTEQVYEMTFDPPNDDAELVDIPAPPGTFLDWAPVHLLTTATLAHCASARPELDWDVRRFRPNLLVDLDAEPFAEDTWSGRQLRIGEAVLTVRQPTVRCAMPLRAQPGLARQPELFTAMTELNAATPNHLGVYLDVATPGTIHPGDRVELLE
ncbi:MAG TPA: MOSC domain-containing protein [Acidimicrobiales bacterium]|nr:MOSC domain-containing protein [Acidimicrobiales bacterium]